MNEEIKFEPIISVEPKELEKIFDEKGNIIGFRRYKVVTKEELAKMYPELKEGKRDE